MAARREWIYHNLAVMLEAGVPVTRALSTIAAGGKGRFAKDLMSLRDAISRGSSLSEAMAKRPRSFPPMEVLIVQAGETAGAVGESMRRLSEWYAFRRRLKRTILSGLSYPLFLFHIAAFLLPLSALFLGEGGLIHYLRSVVGFLVFLYVPMGIVLGVIHLTPPRGLARRILDTASLGIPLLGKGLIHLALGRFSRVFHTLHKAGVPITQALPQAAAVCGNSRVSSWLEGAARSVRAGQPAWKGFPHTIPQEFAAAWAIGEESGSLEEVTARLADSAAGAATSRLSELARWLPRIIYFLVVLWMALKILTVAPIIIGGSTTLGPGP